jgi:predicted secreted hydrolase
VVQPMRMSKNRRSIAVLVMWAAIMLLLAGCGVPGVVAPGKSLPPAATAPPIDPSHLPAIQFPRDEAPHRDLTEWWYYTGHLQGIDPAGRERTYGFELTFFQVLRGALSPVYIGHYAISDITAGQFHFDQRSASEPSPAATGGTATAGFNLAIGDWQISGLNGHDRLQAEMPGYAIALTLDSTKPPALHNGNGLIAYGIGGFSYYYSRTHMDVTGTLTDHGAPIAVTGLAWMDHQWGNFITANGTGWDWFSIQLSDDTEYMIYFIRDATGKTVATDGTLVDAHGQAHVLGSGLADQATGHWQSPTTHITYPSGWSLAVPGGSLSVTPLLRDQELVVTQTTGNAYWEGACSISGSIDGQSVSGESYTELTGYELPAA